MVKTRRLATLVLLVVVLAIATALVVGSRPETRRVDTGRTTTAAPAATPLVKSDVPSIKVVGYEPDNDRDYRTVAGVVYSPYVGIRGVPVVTLQNVSQKRILLVSVAGHDPNSKAQLRGDWQLNMIIATDDGRLDPGESVTASLITPEFTVAAVVFEDGSAEGRSGSVGPSQQYVRDWQDAAKHYRQVLFASGVDKGRAYDAALTEASSDQERKSRGRHDFDSNLKSYIQDAKKLKTDVALDGWLTKGGGR